MNHKHCSLRADLSQLVALRIYEVSSLRLHVKLTACSAVNILFAGICSADCSRYAAFVTGSGLAKCRCHRFRLLCHKEGAQLKLPNHAKLVATDAGQLCNRHTFNEQGWRSCHFGCSYAFNEQGQPKALLAHWRLACIGKIPMYINGLAQIDSTNDRLFGLDPAGVLSLLIERAGRIFGLLLTLLIERVNQKSCSLNVKDKMCACLVRGWGK